MFITSPLEPMVSGYRWFDFGTRSNIDKFVITGGDPGVVIWAVRLDNVLLVNPTGGPKKFYDSNATFGPSKYISIPQDSKFDLGTEPFTLECYVKTSDTSTGYPIIIGRWGSVAIPTSAINGIMSACR